MLKGKTGFVKVTVCVPVELWRKIITKIASVFLHRLCCNEDRKMERRNNYVPSICAAAARQVGNLTLKRSILAQRTRDGFQDKVGDFVEKYVLLERLPVRVIWESLHFFLQ